MEVKSNCKFALLVPFAERYDSQIFPHVLLGHTVLFNLHWFLPSLVFGLIIGHIVRVPKTHSRNEVNFFGENEIYLWKNQKLFSYQTFRPYLHLKQRLGATRKRAISLSWFCGQQLNSVRFFPTTDCFSLLLEEDSSSSSYMIYRERSKVIMAC